MLRMLKDPGGRAAVIVPDGVLFGSSKAHVALRKMLLEENQLEAVISLPAGVFKPYAGVSTAIVVFTRGGKTIDVFFYDIHADGFSLDDKRDPVDESDLPDCLARWTNRHRKKDTDRTQKAFFVNHDEIAENAWNLSIGRYKDVAYEGARYDPPRAILERLDRLERSILDDIISLKDQLE